MSIATFFDEITNLCISIRKLSSSYYESRWSANFIDQVCFVALQLILNSMHKYQPRVHIIRKLDHTASVINLKSEEMKTFTFPETNFIGVTAYQNQLVSHLSCA